VWYFDVTQSTRLTGYLTDPENPVPISLSASDMVGHLFGLFGRTEATSCVVHEWRLNTERRTGVLDGEECVVSDSMDGDSVVYGEDEINGDALGGYSARRIRIEPHVDGTCEAQIDRVACRLDGVNWVDQHQPDLTAELNSVEILYGRNAKLSFSDDNCQVVFHELGHLKQHPSEKSTALKRYHFREKSIGELTTKFEDVIDLVDYVRADASRQQDMMTQLSQRVPEVMTTMGLDAALQSDVPSDC
jgi:Asp-tRNA(Asn)/Glu-tRNA(Gln) amidotransferase C subunit